MIVGKGITIGKGINFGSSPISSGAAPLSASLVYDLDAANFVALPSTGGSFNLNGTSQYLSIASNAAFAFGTGDYTIEGWFYTTSNSGRLWFFDTNTDNVDLNGNGGIFYWNGSQYQSATNTVINLNTWQHIALVRASGTITLYVDGVSVMSQSGIGYDSSSNRALEIGYSSSQGNGYFNGRISNFRIVKGTAVYTANFTPATQPLYPITNTVLCIRPQNSGTLLTDYSAAPLTVTNNGAVTYNSATPFIFVKDATGTYNIIQNNAGSLAWNSANGGSFVKSSNVGTDYIYGGPNYVTAQSYTVFMAYKLSATSAGRLLNTQSEASKDWLMGAYNGNPNTFYPNFSVNLPSTGADTVWHLDFATWNTTTSVGNLYASTSTAPSAVSFTATNAGGGGFNQLRMFSRSSATEVQSGNIAFVKVYNGILTLSDIQSLHATYKTRFGY
jgi:hypothetical protein